ncbi:MAG: acylneuraminate cytidylyltransferase family protein [Candidatus Doudnabacteria bacterium]|nr:acylneuraminate cytidylyltransferase family protein [Candidatus Doudnabacteria bacterium]
MRNICIIPARGGSKRIPKKNIVDFHGQPMIAYTIGAALKSGLFGKNIYISSDSEKILKVARRYKGVRTIKRPLKISDDTALLDSVLLHFLENVPGKFDNLCLLLPTCPLRNATDVKRAYRLFLKSKAPALMSVVAYNWLYPFWTVAEKNGIVDFFFGRKYLVDSKLLPKHVYCPAGGIRFMKVKNFLRKQTFYGLKVAKYEIPFERSADIDTYDDLALAKKLFELQ